MFDHILASSVGLVEDEQERLGRHMYGFSENIKDILELQHLARVDYAYQTALKAERILA